MALVYITASWRRTLYVGVTTDLDRRVSERKQSALGGFTNKYRTHRLVYFGRFEQMGDANTAEKQIKGWHRDKKLALIEQHNPKWLDLATSLGP